MVAAITRWYLFITKSRRVRAEGADATACNFLNIRFYADLRIAYESSGRHEQPPTGIFQFGLTTAEL